ncbi:Bug family tripartite tricarboxylate transporter substrate binding protein [Orrella sp. 11846]|uniref:Bug family tripartite tricarboxylate transporter substrate binding protein n=1 Tax=Orrella sp. 11846 TaxID=3409913 RepID=UPI003B5993C9
MFTFTPTISKRLITTVGLCATLSAIPLSAALAQTDAYPSRPIHLVVPFPPGGGTDLIGRAVAMQLANDTGWTVVVDNKGGAGGTIGVDAAAKAKPDGYTLVLGQTSNLAIGPWLYKSLPYNPKTDLTPIGLVSVSPIAMATGANTPYKTFADVVNASKEKPGSITLGFSGNGTVAHLSGTSIEKTSGIELTHIPYKGASQAMTDLIGGGIDLYMSSIPTLLNQIRAGQLRAIAVTSPERAPELPDTPSLSESGYKDFDLQSWWGILAPAGVPADVVETVNKALNQALQNPELIEKLQASGGQVLGGTPEQFQTYLDQEIERWGTLVKESGVTMQ